MVLDRLIRAEPLDPRSSASPSAHRGSWVAQLRAEDFATRQLRRIQAVDRFAELPER